jgi:RNA 2',3'-cyclic 3'-phosphodiesterase
VRLFFAVELPGKVKGALKRVGAKIPQGESWRWVRSENYHLTLHFLGERDRSELSELQALGRRVAKRHGPFRVKCQGLGTFPNDARNPKVLWAGVQAEEQLDVLATALGGDAGDHHITLARRRQGQWRPVHLSDSKKALSFGEWTVSEIALIESTITRSGPVYTVNKSWEL